MDWGQSGDLPMGAGHYLIDYRELASSVRKKSKGGMSRVTYVGALQAEGRWPIWLGSVILLVLLLLVPEITTDPMRASAGRFLGLWGLLMLSFLTTLVGFHGFLADLIYFKRIIERRFSGADMIYVKAAEHTVRTANRNLLAILSGVFLLAYIISPSVAASIVGLAAVIGLSCFALLLLTWVPKQLIDYYFLLAAATEIDGTMVSKSEELVVTALKCVADAAPPGSLKHLYLDLSESDLRHSEGRREWYNLWVAVIAVIVSVFLTEQLLSASNKIIEQASNLFRSFGDRVADLTQSPLQTALSTALVWTLGLFAINIALGFISLLLRIILRSHFEGYRPAYALNKALIIYFHEHSTTTVLTNEESDSDTGAPLPTAASE